MGILSVLKKRVYSVLPKKNISEEDLNEENRIISLGVLLWVVAESDDHFLPEENEKIIEILHNQGVIAEGQLDIVLAAIDIANKERVELYTFCKEVSDGVAYEEKKSILECLFRVAYADKVLSDEELAMIRKISGLIRLDHKDFIDAKVKIKKEFGLDVVEF